MLTPDNVFLVVKPVDMRRGIDTLTQYVQNELNAAWHDGAAFVFTNKVRSRIKVLRWDKHGVWLCTRRLHRGSFRWPRNGDATWHLTQDEFHWMVCGVDWQQMKGHDLAKWVYQEEPTEVQSNAIAQ
ncbi:IS66 family insertion sequence element accessory protein TnpB [Escherichia coli]|uniref:IS66 family insertion sequence element accessory protein TnpB n=2 Tax=Escherichia coli TaxID=562 RepID=UPI000707398E|nr:IS66 family insertion sequence element accessory protein TnpB [Escherichia coli]KQC23346.1 cytochrome O ubiquinol oxidase [Escherichia coli]